MVLAERESTHLLIGNTSSTPAATRLLTSFFFRFFTGSGVSSSGDAAMPAARFLMLITIVAHEKVGDRVLDVVRTIVGCIRAVTLLGAVWGFGALGRNVTWAIGFQCGSFCENASSCTCSAHPWPSVEILVKGCALGTKHGPEGSPVLTPHATN